MKTKINPALALALAFALIGAATAMMQQANAESNAGSIRAQRSM